MYEYRATLLKVVDGDTIRMMVDLGCDVNIKLTLRLARINAPEMSTDEGQAARGWLIHHLADKVITVKTIKDRREKYGRYLADIYLADECVNDTMVTEGHAVYYP